MRQPRWKAAEGVWVSVQEVGAVRGPEEASRTIVFQKNAAGAMLGAPLPSATRTWEQLPPPKVSLC